MIDYVINCGITMPCIHNNYSNPINWDEAAKIPIVGNVTSLIRIPVNVLKGLFAIINYVGSAITNRETIKAEAQFKASVAGFFKGIIGTIPIIGTIAAIYLFKKQTLDSAKNDENPKHISNEKPIKKNPVISADFKWDADSIKESIETEQSTPIGMDTNPKSSLAKKAHRWFKNKFESQRDESRPKEIIVDFDKRVSNIEIINIEQIAEKAKDILEGLESPDLLRYDGEGFSYLDYINRLKLALREFSTNRDLSAKITWVAPSGFEYEFTVEKIFQKALSKKKDEKNLYNFRKLTKQNNDMDLRWVINETIQFLETFIETDLD